MTPTEAFRALFAGWERGDNDAIADLFAEDAIYDDPLKPGRLVGREQIREANAGAVATITDCRIEVRHLLEEGPIGFAEGVFTSRLVDGGARLDFAFAAVVEVAGGRIRRLAEYFDTRPLLP